MRSKMLPAFLGVLAAMGVSDGAGAWTVGHPSETRLGPRVDLPARARLRDVIRELGNQLPGVRVADVSDSEPVVTQPVMEVPLPDVLARVSRDLDRFWLRKGRTLVLQRRFTDPEENPEVEFEEVRAAVTDLFHLIQPFVKRREGDEAIRAKNDFADSLTQEQQRILINEGLPLARLPEDQRRVWLELTLEYAYGSAAKDAERAARCLAAWERATLSDLVLEGVLPPGGRRAIFAVRFPEPTLRDWERQCRIDVPGPGRSASNLAEGAYLAPDAVEIPKDLRPVWILPSEEVTLQQLADRLARAGGPPVRVPHYARGRRLWVVSNEGTRAEVLDAVGRLWGWDLVADRDGYRLERPRPVPARNPQELHERMLRAIPPTLLHHLRLRQRGGGMRMPRQMSLVAEAAERAAGRNWVTVPVTKLDALAQRRLANCIAIRQLSAWFTHHGKERAPEWLTHPERGVLSLGGMITPDSHPLLKFSVVKDDGKTRTEDFWGWFVNTSSLKRN